MSSFRRKQYRVHHHRWNDHRVPCQPLVRFHTRGDSPHPVRAPRTWTRRRDVSQGLRARGHRHGRNGTKQSGAAADHLATAYIVSSETDSLGAGSGIEQGTPVFADAAGQDYHLARHSIGVDLAPAQDGLDLDGSTRTVDIANDFGPTDAGAYEIQTPLPPGACFTADTIFCDSFEVLP